jgi:hypothetical protein
MVVFRKVKFFRIALALAFALTFSEEIFAKDKIKLNRTKTAKPTKSGISFLTFEQVSALPQGARIKYIREFRKAFLSIEEFQLLFKDRIEASIHRQSYDFYALLFGDNVFAQGAKHERGALCVDQCIFAYHVTNYMKPGGKCVRFPDGCTPPPSCSRGGQTKGYQCNFLMTGLQGIDSCISINRARGATVTCENARNANAEKNKQRTKAIVEQAKTFFSFGGKVNPNTLNSSNAKQIIQSLVDSMYDDSAYAALIGIMKIYKDNKIDFPSDNLEIKGLPQKFDSVSKAADEIFKDYINLCNQELSAGVVKEIQDEVHGESESKLKAEERVRKGYLTQVLRQGAKPTVRNVLQVEECKNIDQRVSGIRRALSDIEGQLPIVSDVAQPPSRPVDQAPVSGDIKPVGCSDGGVMAISKIYNTQAQCTLCAMEKSVHNSSRDDTAEGSADSKSYSVSKKWVALLGIMSRACGLESDSSIGVDQINELYQTFGHCSTDTYDWDTADEALRSDDDRRLEDWANNSYWTDEQDLPTVKRKLFGSVFIPQPDKENNFARVFGISYQTATSVFCDPSTFNSPKYKINTSSDGYSKIVKKGKKEEGESGILKEIRKCNAQFQNNLQLKHECTQNILNRGRIQRMADGRRRLDYAIKNNYIKNEAPPGVITPAKGLQKCLSESLSRAQRLYNENSNVCMSSKRLDYAELKQQMESDQAPGNLISRGDQCLVGHQTEDFGPKGKSLTFVFPRVNIPGASEQSAVLELARVSVINRSGTGDTIDYYMPFNITGNAADHAIMTTQASCSDYMRGVAAAGKKPQGRPSRSTQSVSDTP